MPVSSLRKFERLAETKILFATDLHGSETFFGKILSVAKSFKVDILLISGDLTGKAIVPIVKTDEGRYFTTFFGRNYNISEAEGLRTNTAWRETVSQASVQKTTIKVSLV